jgi:hypothetical protein
MQILYNGLLEILGRLLYTYLCPLLGACEVIRGSCGSSSQLFVIVVTESHFVHDSCKIMTALIIM